MSDPARLNFFIIARENPAAISVSETLSRIVIAEPNHSVRSATTAAIGLCANKAQTIRIAILRVEDISIAIKTLERFHIL